MPNFDAWLEDHYDRKRYGMDESPEPYWEDIRRELRGGEDQDHTTTGTPAWVLETTEDE